MIGLAAIGLVLNACGTPAIAVNAYNPGAAIVVAGATTATSVPTTSAVAGMDSMPGMTNPTAVANPATAIPITVTPGPSPTELVIDWLLYGTPTNTPNGVAQSPQLNAPQVPVTPTSNTVQAGVSPTAATVQISTLTPVLTGTALPPTLLASPTVPPSAIPATAGANSGNAARGQALFQGAATCSSCHDVANGVTIVGPSLKGVASRAGSREPGKSAADYLHESIVTPNAFVVPGFQPNVMPQSFAQTLSAQQIDDLVAYLLTLK